MSTLLKIRGQICGGSLTDVYRILLYRYTPLSKIYNWTK